MSEPTPEEIEAKFKEIFEEVSGGDDKITHSDLKKALKKGGIEADDDQIQAIIDAADVEGTGYISFEEFCRVIVGAQFMKLRVAMALRLIFMAADTDGTGYVTADNLKEVCQEKGVYDKVAQEKIDEIISACDQTGDGNVSFEEFLQGLANADWE